MNKRTSLILILGSLTALSPFSIDMYLSAFPLMAQYFQTDVAQVSITLSSYFIGLASGQLFYGPLMDRFGRKRPLIIGLLIYIFASICCGFANSIETLIVLRFIQAVGGCAASVGAFAMVRDLFEPRESAKILSLLILILGVSPLLAPTVGGYLSIYMGWQSVFAALAIGSSLLLFVVMKFLPESHHADKSHVLRPLPIIKNYFSIISEPLFSTYALAGAVGFSGLFVYLAASPTIFMEVFKVSEQVYGWIFAFIAMGMVGTSQLNVVLLKKFSNEQILQGALLLLVLTSTIFLICAFNDWYNVYGVVITMFIYLSSIGLSNPNAAALAMAPFAKKAGSAAAMLGFLQMAIGSLASVMVGVLKAQQLAPIGAIFVSTSALAFMILLLGSKRIAGRVVES
ncbi:multidrug effflux MFS transporter [Peredibacter sp. HCB2-198]|uniref:multidrug effflux MFS transporter n=1 Tax=Peredibacter sp. HCB2-198 TaxID=3383025 RepID=UPI0038B64F59